MRNTCSHTGIPPYMLGAMQRYLDHRIAPGGFLTAMLENKLVDAFHQADENNLKAMQEWAAHLYWCLPSLCWGSPEKVNQWLAAKEETHA